MVIVAVRPPGDCRLRQSDGSSSLLLVQASGIQGLFSDLGDMRHAFQVQKQFGNKGPGFCGGPFK